MITTPVPFFAGNVCDGSHYHKIYDQQIVLDNLSNSMYHYLNTFLFKCIGILYKTLNTKP